MKIPLDRPALVAIDTPIDWPLSISVAGAHALAFVAFMKIDARVLCVELRHAEGFVIEGDVVRSHPSALIEAIESTKDDRFTIGVGNAFAAAVRSRLSIWIRGEQHALALSPVERDIVRRADLVLEEAREGVAAELASRISRGEL